MLMTVTNTSSTLSLNALDVLSGGVGVSALSATGGQRLRILPYPFGHAVIAPSGTLQLAIHPRDWRKQNGAVTLSPAEEWNQLVQSGMCTLSFAAETGRRDVEELFTTAV